MNTTTEHRTQIQIDERMKHTNPKLVPAMVGDYRALNATSRRREKSGLDFYRRRFAEGAFWLLAFAGCAYLMN